MEYAALLIQAKWRSVVLSRRKVMEIFQGSRGKVLIVRKTVFDSPRKATAIDFMERHVKYANS